MYCYMKRFPQKPIRFDDSELKTDLGQGNFIFVGSGCDIFAEDIPVQWIQLLLNHCKSFDNTYLFQTKNVIKLWEFLEALPPKTKVCTTIETNRWIPEIMRRSPKPAERSGWLARFKGIFDIYITIEPIMDFDLDAFLFLLSFPEPKQVNIGADSGRNNLPEPSREKLTELIEELNKFTTIDKKTNLKRLLK